MKRAIRMLILMVGLAGAYSVIASPFLSAELGPPPMCPQKNCGK